ncbi:MAG: [FeFe] hydrogenase, group A [Planctomycetota bacterium]|jgi:NADH-quinone oxidoreductase subunit G/[NiFe] hydrogenase diaphorase moiety small subunit
MNTSTATATKTITVTINDKAIEVKPGTTILEAARELGEYIPTLCFHPDLCANGLCRICMVEVDEDRIQAACTTQIDEPITVRTHTPRLRGMRRDLLSLLLAEHEGDCTTCDRGGCCELQQLCEECGLRESLFPKLSAKTVPPTDTSSPSIVRDMSKCVLCRRCIHTCSGLQAVGAITPHGRGSDTTIGTYQGAPLSSVPCINCGQCVNRCPTGALVERSHIDRVWAALEDESKHVVIQTAPAPRAGIGELFGCAPGTALTRNLNTALRRLGFDKVFDTNFAADLTIIEEATELILRLYRALVLKDESQILPQFTSCSPGWIKFIEHHYPHRLGHLSSAKSPQQMFGALIKTWYAESAGVDPASIVNVALMPCTAKKFEIDRPEFCDSGYRDVDLALTTRELGTMIHEFGLNLPELEPSAFDSPFGEETGSGVVFGATGGVMEAALRTALEFITGVQVEDIFKDADILPVRGFEGIKVAEIPMPDEFGPVPELIAHLVPDWEWLRGAVLKVAIAHGTGNAQKVLENLDAGGEFASCHFIEFMACPGGCLGGGGQPIPTSAAIRQARAKAIYAEDTRSQIRKSHENRAVLRVYQDFLTDGPCGKTAHHLLHTTYTPRGHYITTGD